MWVVGGITKMIGMVVVGKQAKKLH